MSVILVNNDTFYGYLVRRTANSQIKSKYFSLSKKVNKSYVPVTEAQKQKILAQAEKYDEELAEWQAKQRQKLKAECRPSKRNNTGVRGIILGQHRDCISYAFMVAVTDATGTPVMKSFNIDLGWERAWSKACKFLSKKKAIPVEPLLKKIPDQKILSKVN